MPVRARPEQAPYFPASRQITPIPGPDSEVLALARLVAGQPRMRARRVLSASAPGTWVLDDAALVAAALLVAVILSRGVLNRSVLNRSVLNRSVLNRSVLNRGVLRLSVLSRGVLGAIVGRRGRVNRQVCGTVGAAQRCIAGEPGQLNGRSPDTLGAAASIGRHRESVIRVRPQAGLVWVLAGRLNLRRQRGQLVAAPLADDREGLPVQHEPERDLIWQARLVKTRDRGDAEQRSIYAA